MPQQANGGGCTKRARSPHEHPSSGPYGGSGGGRGSQQHPVMGHGEPVTSGLGPESPATVAQPYDGVQQQLRRHTRDDVMDLAPGR